MKPDFSERPGHFYYFYSWIQTSLSLAASPLCRMIMACHFMVIALSGNITLKMTMLPNWIEINCLPVYLGKVARSLIDWQGDIYLLLWFGLPSVASGAWAVIQISPSRQQCTEQQASLKAAAVCLTISNPKIFYIYVMWSSKMSLKSKNFVFVFCIFYKGII